VQIKPTENQTGIEQRLTAEPENRIKTIKAVVGKRGVHSTKPVQSGVLN
jgi:hypothetical protein